MQEENGDDTKFPEPMELQFGKLILNSERSEDEVCDITIDEGTKLGDMMENSSMPEGEACDITIDREGMEADIADEKVNSDGSVEETNDLVNEEAEDLRCNGDTEELMIGKIPSSMENRSTGGQVRKKSTAFIVGANQKPNVHSRYLSSPVGSCHDFCKHGHRRESNGTPSPLGINRGARPLMRTHSMEGSKSVSKEDTKKKLYIRRLSLPGPPQGKHGKETCEDVNFAKKNLNQSELKRLQSENKPSSVPTQRASKSKIDVQPSNNKVVVRNFNLLESSSLGIKTIKTRKEAETHIKSEKSEEKGKPMRSSFSPTLIKKSPSMKARLYKNLKSLSLSNSSKLGSSKEAKDNGSGDVPEKTLYMIEPDIDKSPAKRPSSRFASSNESMLSSSGGSRGSNVYNFKKANLKGNRSGKIDLDSTNTKTEDGGSKSDMPRGGSKPNTPRSKSTMGNAVSKPNTSRVKLAKGGGGGGSKPSTPRAMSATEKIKGKGKVSGAVDKDVPAWKVKFKKGTVVSLQNATNSPKKLVFKRARILGEDQSGKGDLRGLKNRERKEPHDAKQIESRKVRLRHQEASSKKDTIDLNNVIEETASQLVKTRKSKVKALVGAFETVMSLRGRKLVVETGAS